MLIFSLISQDLSFGQLIAVLIAYFIAICIAMTIHEFAHSFTAYKCGDITPKATGRLTLNPFAHFSGFGLLCFFLIGFGWAKPVKINPLNFRNYRKGLILTSISGILANLVLAFILSGLYYFLAFNLILASDNLLFYFLYYLLAYSFLLNIVLFLFNILPIAPLDGFNFVSIFTKYDNKVMQFLERYSFTILIILIIPFFNGFSDSILHIFYDYALPAIENVFFAFWGLF